MEGMHRAKTFKNLDPAYRSPGRHAAWRFVLRRISRRLSLKMVGVENLLADAMPENPWAGHHEPGKNRATWVGHSTVLCSQDGSHYLTDPMFSDHAGPFRYMGPRRYTPPALRLESLPKIDFVLISHSHYDHLDLKSVRAISRRDDPLFLVPEGLGRWFRARKIGNVVEVPWWKEYRIGQLTVIGVPSQHYSVRTLWDRNKSHWCGWVVKGEKTFYYPGDTGYGHFFKRIGEKFGPMDLAAMPIGAYAPQVTIKSNHINPEEALDVLSDVGGRKMLAVHWGTFDLTEEPFDEPPLRLAAEANRRGLKEGMVNVIRIGETIYW